MGKQDATYEITNPDFDESGHSWATNARLLRLGDFLFVDLGSSDLEDSKNATVFTTPPSWAKCLGGHILRKTRCGSIS